MPPNNLQQLMSNEQLLPWPSYDESFYLYSFKIAPCRNVFAHNWSTCPFVHPKEKARRRDPRLYNYQPLPCPEDRKGTNCPHGDQCIYTHNVFEYWLHPQKFRTRMCQHGPACTRPLCFFAHSVEELRVVDHQSNTVLSAAQLALAPAPSVPAAAPWLPPALAGGNQEVGMLAAARSKRRSYTCTATMAPAAGSDSTAGHHFSRTDDTISIYGLPASHYTITTYAAPRHAGCSHRLAANLSSPKLQQMQQTLSAMEQALRMVLGPSNSNLQQ